MAYGQPGMWDRLRDGAGGMFEPIHNWAEPRSNRLMLTGMGLLSGKTGAEGWEGAMKGLVAGSALDKDARSERAIEEMLADPNSTLGGIPAADKAFVMRNPDIAGGLMAARLKPQEAPNTYSEYALTTDDPSPAGYRQFLTDKAAANRITIEQGGKFTDWTALRGDLENSPGTKNYRLSIPKLRSMAASVNDTTKMSDFQFIYGMAQIFDPDSVVRSEEGKAVVDSQSIPAALKGQWESMLNSGAGLGPTARRDLVQTAARRVQELNDQARAEHEWYQGIAERHGIDFRDIGRPLEPMPDLSIIDDEFTATPH